MADSVYKVIELVGTSTDSWERAAAAAIDQASSTLRGLRVAEVKELDVALACLRNHGRRKVDADEVKFRRAGGMNPLSFCPQIKKSLDEGGAKTYRAKLSVSFKYEGGG